MDKATRSAIERATQQARKLLDEDFSSQLEGTFDVLRSGVIAAEGGAHLSARQKFQRGKIVAAIEHKRAAGATSTEAITDYVRDAAFTALNRFVALKMLEARQLVQECITKGEQSGGYKEFCGMAPGLALLPDGAGYRLYVESLFDEFSTEIKVLFDRRDAASVLWPKRQTFDALLALLNAPDLSAVWSDDETIGWVYQYFNSKEERQSLRASQQGGSQAPRNRRDMAVRNQFFTPRYVVQFLVDNTLGRLWLEMHGDKSRLVSLCKYHVQRSAEPLKPRARKDPRDLRILDPAVGSGHFLLYSFDLLMAIYEEAWLNEGFDVASEITGRTLRQDYKDLSELRRATPKLIVELNLHGVDIDPRCAQIAALAIWLRAQRAWKDAEISASDRPRIQRTHIVVAEPIPGHAELVDEFAARLDPPLLRDLFKKMIVESNLAGELGVLLRLEDAIAVELRRAREQFVKQREMTSYLPGMNPEIRQPSLDLSGIDDDSFFQDAEFLIVRALRDFAEAADKPLIMRRRLFADDAADGIALIDLARHRFDVILMNPPFGDPSILARKRLDADYLAAKHDIASAFLERSISLLAPQGLVGAIVTRTIFFLQYLREWREKFLFGQTRMSVFADMGIGVLDAMVETSLVCLENIDSFDATPTRFITANREGEREEQLRNFGAYRSLFQEHLTKIPGSPIAFSVSDEILELFSANQGVEGPGRGAFTGALTQDDFRFVRAWWEVSVESIARGWTTEPTQKWVPYVSGGSHNPIYADVHNLIRWEQNGRELKSFLTAYRGSKGFADQWTSQLNSYSNYFRPGAVWSLRPLNQGSFWLLPKGCIFGNNAPALLADKPDDILWMVGILNSAIFRAILSLLMPRGNSGTSTLKYNLGYVRSVPIPSPSEAFRSQLIDGVTSAWTTLRHLGSLDETNHAFLGVLRVGDAKSTVQEREAQLRKALTTIEKTTAELYGVSDSAVSELLSDSGVAPCEENLSLNPVVTFARQASDLFYRTQFLVGMLFGRWQSDHSDQNDSAPADTTVGSMATAPNILCRTRNPSCKDILVQDEGHPDDILTAVLSFAEQAGAGAILQPSEEDEVRRLLKKDFFRKHLIHYSTSTRKAPIYWQLATPSASYSVWLYVHALNKDTLFRVQKDFVTPKLSHEMRKLEDLRRDFGGTPKQSQRKILELQTEFVEELRSFLERLRSVSGIFHPDIDDGVVINFAPLWTFTAHHKPWQKELVAAWEALCAGEYDWSHLAMHLWPERVVPKCATDRSLAIAHGLEVIFWVEGDDGKWKPRLHPTRLVADLIQERTSAAVKAALLSLREASAPVAARTRVRRSA